MARGSIVVRSLAVSAMALLVLCASAPATADELLDGIAAYKAGDWDTAHAKLAPLAESGDPEAHFYLGYMYETGKGVTADLPRAIEHYRVAADAGDPKAQFNLGAALEAGRGVEVDEAEAHRWYLAAAEQGFERGQYKVADMFENGRGVEPDLIMAYKWFKIAGRDRYEDSRKRKKKIANRLDLYEIAEGDLQARLWFQKQDGTD